MLVRDPAVPADQERLGHAVDAPVDSRAAIAVDADRGIGIAELTEEAAGVLRFVLVVEAGDLDAAILRQGHQQRMLLPARRAP